MQGYIQQFEAQRNSYPKEMTLVSLRYIENMGSLSSPQ